MLKKIILITAAMGLVGCAFDKNDNGNTAAEVAERQLQETTYNKIVAVYTGKLMTATSEQDVELNIFTIDKVHGSDSKGRTRSSKELRATYKRINPVDADVHMQVVYYPETSDLILINDKDINTLSIDEVQSIGFKVKDNVLTGLVKSKSGTIGSLTLTLSSKESKASGGTNANEYYERVYRQYQAIAGIYAGESVLNGQTNYRLEVTLTAEQNTDKTQPPLLNGAVRIYDDAHSLVLTIDGALYQPELTPAKLIFKAREDGSEPVSFEGILVGDEFKGAWETKRGGKQGNFVLKKLIQ